MRPCQRDTVVDGRREALRAPPPPSCSPTSDGCRRRSACVLLIGHNPGIGDLAVMLAGHGDRAARAAMAAKFPTAALALLAIDRRWSAAEAGAATLDEFWTPR